MLNFVAPGTTFVADVLFKNADGSAFAGTAPAQYNIRDFDGNLVLSGYGQQDTVVTGRWYANLTLPASVPVGDETQRYSLNWTIANATNTFQNTQAFSVAYINDMTFLDNNRIVLDSDFVSDSLALPATAPVDAGTLRVRIYDVTNCMLFDSAAVQPNPVNPTPAVQYDKNVYSLALTTPVAGFTSFSPEPYILQWTWTANRVPQSEFHFLTAVSPKHMLLMGDLRNLLDRARNLDINPYLVYTDVDLARYLLMGLARLNGWNPTETNFSIHTLPYVFNTCLMYCAGVEALNAQLIAEGVSAFDFAGQSVTLSVNRTAQLEGALERWNGFLDSNLQKQKKVYMRSGGGTGVSAGVLAAHFGPTTTRIITGAQLLARLRYFQGGAFDGLNFYN